MITPIFSLPFHVVSGIRSVLSSGKLLGLFVAQLAIAVVSYAVLTYLTLHYRESLTAYITGDVTSTWEVILSWVIFVLSLIVNGLLSYIVMMLIGGFIMESFVQDLMKKASLPVDEEFSTRSVARMVTRTAKVTVMRLFAGLVILLMMGISIFVPPLSIVVTLATMFLIGVDMLELPVSLMLPEARRKLSLLSNHKLSVLAFGAVAALVLVVPLIGLFLVPILYAAAVSYLSQLYGAAGGRAFDAK